MKKNLLIAVFLMAILVTTLVVAFQIVTPVTPITVTHGTSGSGSFVINNTTPGTVTLTTCTASGSYASWMTFSNCVAGTAIPAAGTYTVNFNVAVPRYTAASLYVIPITISGIDAFSMPIADTENANVIVPASPAMTITTSTSVKGYPTKNYVSSFLVTNTGNTQLNNILFSYAATDMTDDDGDIITLSFDPSTVSLNAGENATINMTAAIPAGMDYGTYNTDVIATSGTTTASMDATVEVKRMYCYLGDKGNYLTLTINEPDKNEKFQPGSEITVEASVKNSYTDDLDVVMEAQLFDIDDNVYLENAETDMTITEGHEETMSTTIKVPFDIEDDHHYAIVVKAYEDGDEDVQCKDDMVAIDIEKEAHKIILESKTVTPSPVECDGTFSAVVKFGNAGRNDEDKVKVRLYNTELGIDVEKTFALDEGDYYSATFNSLKIPKDAEEKDYILNIDYFYDYDSSAGEYDISKSDELTVPVKGNCLQKIYDVLLDAQQISSAKLNTETSIKVTLTNTGNQRTTYSVGASGYDAWASLGSVEPTAIALDPGAVGYVYVKITPKETGTHAITLKASYEGQTETKDLNVDVLASSSAASWFEQLWFSIKHNWQWVIVNAILAIAIIVLIVLLLTRKPSTKSREGQVFVVKGNKSSGPTEINLKSAKKKRKR